MKNYKTLLNWKCFVSFQIYKNFGFKIKKNAQITRVRYKTTFWIKHPKLFFCTDSHYKLLQGIFHELD